MNTIRIVLADDQVLFVESLKTVLETRTKDIKVVGIAYDGEEVLDIIETSKPHIVLMDIRMPGMNGVECTKWLSEKYPEVHVMMLTTFDDDEFIVQALGYGAVGYLLKDVQTSYLIEAIYSVSRGGLIISPMVATKLINKTILRDFSTKKDSCVKSFGRQNPVLEELTTREIEVLTLISKGLSNKEIAERLYIAEQTVKNHVSMIYAKLDVHDRVHALIIAKEIGLD